MKKFYLVLFVGLALPVVALADGVSDIITDVGGWIDLLTPIVVGLALLYFFWGLAMFILKSGEEKEKGKDIMVYGIIALFVMVSVWGLVSFVGTTFGISDVGTGTDVVAPSVGS